MTDRKTKRKKNMKRREKNAGISARKKTQSSLNVYDEKKTSSKVRKEEEIMNYWKDQCHFFSVGFAS